MTITLYHTAPQIISLLSLGDEYTQYVIKSEKGLSKLQWESSFTLSDKEIQDSQKKIQIKNKDFQSQFYSLLQTYLKEE